MKGFMVNAGGDVVISDNEVMMVEGDELLRQTIQQVLGTNKREWFLNTGEGVDFSVMLRKRVDHGEIRAELQDGLRQVDEDLVLDEYSAKMSDREMTISFKAKNSDGEVLEGATKYS